MHWAWGRTLLAALVLLALGSVCHGGDTFILAGKVVDGTGREVDGAEIFVYDTPAVRRPADFISARTGGDGAFSLTLPRKKYWVVARVRKGEKFGPLLPGGRHSGEPVEVDPETVPEVRRDFTVADLREAYQSRQKARASLSRVTGRIVDSQGRGVPNAYTYAVVPGAAGDLPTHISRWTDETGEYALYLPPGKHLIRAALRFPPGGEPVGGREVSVAAGMGEGTADIQVVGAAGAERRGAAGDDDE